MPRATGPDQDPATGCKAAGERDRFRYLRQCGQSGRQGKADSDQGNAGHDEVHAGDYMGILGQTGAAGGYLHANGEMRLTKVPR